MADASPRPTTPYLARVEDLARRRGFPALVIADEVIGPGQAAWARWLGAADRLQLVRALGALTARTQRPPVD